MSAYLNAKRGDWVKATAKNGSSIIGQILESDSSLANWVIAIQDNSGQAIQLHINVNFWTVELLMGNLIPEGPF
jgi:hypothetical protein